ncbi:hypothetical protein ANO14919_098560 [Xylariales sp. No.14919]|nr:hypothetical protein ANO14919_098560 [Xylariales sp. No.14919]
MHCRRRTFSICWGTALEIASNDHKYIVSHIEISAAPEDRNPLPLSSQKFIHLAIAELAATSQAPALSTADSLGSAEIRFPRASFRDDFTEFNRYIWSCEYTCPTIENERARFHLSVGIEPDQEGSWSKARYKPERFTASRFTVGFFLTARPAQKSISADIGVNLYGEEYHNATLEYDYEHVAFYFDGNLLHKTTDMAPIPTDPMDLVLGPRIVTSSEPLTEFFLESFDWVEIE